MSKFKKNSGNALPQISTASLPDIVFMLLFFFMVVTVLRETSLMVENRLPTANELEKLDKKNLVMYIYAGKPSSSYQEKYGTEARIQLNDKYAEVKDIQAFIYSEREARNENEVPFLTTALKVDGETNMGLITDIKQELRKANALKINYTTKAGDVQQNF